MTAGEAAAVRRGTSLILPHPMRHLTPIDVSKSEAPGTLVNSANGTLS